MHLLVVVGFVVAMVGMAPAGAEDPPVEPTPDTSVDAAAPDTTAPDTTVAPAPDTTAAAPETTAPPETSSPTTAARRSSSAKSSTTTTSPGAISPLAAPSGGGSVSSKFSQCANGKDGGVDCDWINGILIPNNSEYVEGMSVPQRILLQNVTGSAHDLTFEHRYTKGGIHAYDFLASIDQASATGLGSNVSFAPAIACADLGGDQAACEALVNGAIFADVTIPDYSGQTQDDAYVALHGTRTARIYGDAAISNTSFDPIVLAGSTAGDSDLQYSLNFTSTGTKFLVMYAGHLAVGNDLTAVSWGSGQGAGSISGGSYHHKLSQLDGASLGATDNQIQSNAVAIFEPQGSITIVKDANPADDTSFGFTATGSGVSDFSLTDPSSDTQSFTGLSEGTYTFTEAAVAGWDLTDITCTGDATVTEDMVNRTVSLGLPVDGNATCTFQNTKRGSVTVAKIVSSNRADKATFDFPFTSTLPGHGSFSLHDAQSEGPVSVAPGDYTITEGSLPPGFALGSIVCTDQTTGNVQTGAVTVNVSPGENVTCTYTNNDVRSDLVVVKQTNPDGDPTSFDFTTTVPGATPFQLSDGQSQGYVVVAGTYGVTETVPAGWSLTGVSCNGSPKTVTNGAISVDVPASSTVTCTYTNTLQGSITVVKEADPANGTPFGFTSSRPDPDDAFTLTPNGGTAQRVLGGILPGQPVTIDELTPAGWTLENVECDGGDWNATATGVVASLTEGGQSITCTFSNFLPRGSITIIKQTLPDGATQAFSFGGDLGAFQLTDGQSDVTNDLLPGSYTVTETPAAGWDLTNLQCNDDDAEFAGFGVTLGVDPGEDITCTFTNTQRGSITIVKSVENPLDHDDIDSFDFGFDTNGDPTPNFTLSDGESIDFLSQLPGDYDFTEVEIPAGFGLVDVVCNDESVPSGDGVTVSLQPGENVTCTFTNEDLRSDLVVVKQTNPDGNAAPFDFTTDAGSPFTLHDGESQGFVVLAGDYGVDENVPTGWQLSDVTCVDDTQGTQHPIITDGAISVAVGEQQTVTCTFTNTKLGDLTIVKDASPADDTEFDFSGDLGAFTLTDPSEPTKVFTNVDPGTYTVGELLPAGWDLTGVDCSDGQTPDVTGGSVDIVVEPDDQLTCTFHNFLQRASITVVKQTLPDGSPAEFDFGGDLGGFTLGDGDSHGSGDILPFQGYDLTEDALAGWDLTGVECTGTASGNVTDISGGVTVTPQPGQDVTCTFTNTQRGSITIVKDVVSDHADASSFEFDFEAPGDDFSLTDGASETKSNLEPGSYRFDEVGIPAGFDLQGISCSDQSGRDGDGVTVSLQPGESVECTFTNVDLRGDLTIVKQTLPNGSSEEFDFGGDLGAFTLTDGASHSEIVVAGDYTVGETVPDGWELTDVTCDDGEGEFQPTVTDGSITVDVGENADITCTFTNTEEGSITLVKDAGDDADGTSFDYTLGGLGDGALTLTPDPTDSATYDELLPGTYTADEIVPAGWSITGISCSDESDTSATGVTVDLAPGENVTCTFTNAINRSTIRVVKMVDGTPTAGWVYDLTSNSEPTTVDPTVTTGDDGSATASVAKVLGEGSSISIDEQLFVGYSFTEASCNDGESEVATDVDVDTQTATVTVLPGQDLTCTFDNARLPASISIVKTADPTEAKPGDEITYTYVVTNTGEVTLVDVKLTDDKLGDITLDDTTLDPGESTTAHATHVITEDEIGTLVNVGTTTGTPVCEGPEPVQAEPRTAAAQVRCGDDVTAEDDAKVVVEKVTPLGASIDLEKTPSVTDAKPGDTVVYTYVITNSGPVRIDDLSLFDDKLGDIALPQTSLEVGESITVQVSHVVTEAEIGDLINVATVNGHDPDGVPVSDTDTATVHVTQPGKPVLPFTGSATGRAITFGLLLVTLGGAAVLMFRRRRVEEIH